MVELLDARGRCLACARLCDLLAAPGLCGVRRLDKQGRLVVDGTVTHVALQPIERKPLYHYRPGTQLLTVGSWGCGTRCAYCRNADTALARTPRGGKSLSPGGLVRTAIDRGAAGVAFSFNEPLIRAEWVAEVCAASIESGLDAVIVSSGWGTPAVLDLLVPVTTVWRIDVKSASNRSAARIFHEPHPPWQSTFSALRMLAVAGRHVEVSLTYSPSIHEAAELLRMGELVIEAAGPDTAVHLQPLLPAHRLRSIRAPELSDLLAARRTLRTAGARHVYVHYLGSPKLRTTWCSCGASLVRRSVASVEVALLSDGRCLACSAPSPVNIGGHAAVIA